MKSVPSAVADGLNAQLEVDREFILSPAFRLSSSGDAQQG